MRTSAVLTVLMLLTPLLIADNHHVEVDDKVDFSAFTTFVVREGRAATERPELNNKLTLKTIEDAIRSELLSKGLKETQNNPDLIVNFNLDERGQRGVVGRGIRNAQVVRLSEGTLVIDMTARPSNNMVWHGIYSDEESAPSKLAKRLPGDARKLLSEYPPKKKK